MSCGRSAAASAGGLGGRSRRCSRRRLTVLAWGSIMLEISLLGEQRVAMDGSVVVALGAPRSMALLGFLLVHRDAPQRREHIAAQFWPDSTDAQARTNLRRELHSMRAGFPQVDHWLAADGGTLLWRLSQDCQLDVAAFEAAADAASKARAAGDEAGFHQAAAEAVRLYRGELMPALYDDWVMPERDRLHRSCLTLLDQLITLDRDAGAFRSWSASSGSSRTRQPPPNTTASSPARRNRLPWTRPR